MEICLCLSIASNVHNPISGNPYLQVYLPVPKLPSAPSSVLLDPDRPGHLDVLLLPLLQLLGGGGGGAPGVAMSQSK